MNNSLLKVEKTSIHFGGIKAVQDVSFDIKEKELFGLIGPNGAGKTTCFNMITGFYKPTHGRVSFNGIDISEKSMSDIVEMGIARTFQNIRLFSKMTVLENVMAAAIIRKPIHLLDAMLYSLRAIEQTEELKSRAIDWLKVVGLENKRHSISSSLPYGEQRRLEIARAMATNPKLLLLDEPAAGMNPTESKILEEVIRRLKNDFNTTILLIEHDMKFVMNLCENIVVLDSGKKLAEGMPEEIKKNPKVVEAYLGVPQK